MNDREIIALYWAKKECAISATAEKYGRYCHTIAYNILYDHFEAEECVNDTYLGAWNSIPPHKPDRLSAFLGKSLATSLLIDTGAKGRQTKRRRNRNRFV